MGIHGAKLVNFIMISKPISTSRQVCLSYQRIETVLASSGKSSAPKGVYSVKDETVRNNLMGVSPAMNKKGWIDSQGRKGKGLGVYRYASKYGANVDGYSPIYSPDEWSETGNTFSLGTKGLLAWAGLLLVLLGVGINLVIATSQLGQ